MSGTILVIGLLIGAATIVVAMAISKSDDNGTDRRQTPREDIYGDRQ